MPIMDINNNIPDLVKTASKRKFWIFGNSCHKYLMDKCNRKKCKFAHELPDAREVGDRLAQLDVNEVRSIVDNEIKHFHRLLEKYFCIVCEYFSRNQLKSDLIDLIMICKNPTKQMESNVVHILDALVKMGLEYPAALIMILDFYKKISKKSMFVLTSLITDRRNNKPQMFLEYLKLFREENGFKFHNVIIERLMTMSLECQSFQSWHRFVRALINQATEDELETMNQDLLQRFCKINPARPNYSLLR